MNKNSDAAQGRQENAPPEERDGDAAVPVQPVPRRKPMAKKLKKRTPAEENGEPKKKGRKPQRSFPVVTLEEAIKIARAIRQKNEGHPFDTNLVAKASGLSRKRRSLHEHPWRAARGLESWRVGSAQLGG